MEILTGTLFYVQVENDATVADLKKEIESQQKLPCDRLILLLDDDESHLMMSQEQDEVSLVECGVRDGSHIYLFFNPLDDWSSQHLAFTLPDSLSGLP